MSGLAVLPTKLIGRAPDVEALREVLVGENSRLLTITGPGGVGKTRLALALANEVADAFADGVVAVPLAPLADPSLVLPTVARTLGLSEGEEEPIVALERHLRERQLLLVLDNFEHVAEASPFLVDLVAACLELKVLVTSRARLRVSGESEYILAPLAGDAATALFLDRARAANPGLEIGGDGLSAVGDICVALDGLPLAIELAAARTKLPPPEAMRARLGQRLELLKAGPRDLPTRQQALRHTLDWSFKLLSAEEQQFFARLGSSPAASRSKLRKPCAAPAWTTSPRSSTTASYRRTGSASRCSRRFRSTPARSSRRAGKRTRHAARTLSTTSLSRRRRSPS